MHLKTTLITVLLLISLLASACRPVASTSTPLVDLVENSFTPSITETPTVEIQQPSTSTPTVEVTRNEYVDCGTGELVDKIHFYKDQNGEISPTQLEKSQVTSDEVRRYVSVVTCLMHDEGWQSDPSEVEGGYENVIIFFDKYGKGHRYRIIVGGHYIAPYDPTHKDITASITGEDGEYKFFLVDDWISVTRDYFATNNIRQIGLDVYIDDTDGNLSSVLKQVYQFRETNQMIEDALWAGEGYPEQVPEGFYLFATRAWLFPPEE